MIARRKRAVVPSRIVAPGLFGRTASPAQAANPREGIVQIFPPNGAVQCLLVPFQGFEGFAGVFRNLRNFALYLLGLRGYTHPRRRGRVVEGAPLLRE